MFGQESGFCPTVITGISPESGEEGDSVTVNGTNFDPIPENYNFISAKRLFLYASNNPIGHFSAGTTPTGLKIAKAIQ